MWIDDVVISKCHEKLVVNVFIPNKNLVVLGKSNQASSEVFEEICNNDGVEILRRKGGGGTVLLHPGCVVVTVGTWVREYYDNLKYFKFMNQSLIKSLGELKYSFHSIQEKGISDLTFEGKKIVGSSLFRSKNYLLYQASILVESHVSLIEKYLRHPTKEPDYRNKKNHREFLSSLQEIENEVSPDTVKNHLQKYLKQNVYNLCLEEIISPEKKHVEVLLKRNHVT